MNLCFEKCEKLSFFVGIFGAVGWCSKKQNKMVFQHIKKTKQKKRFSGYYLVHVRVINWFKFGVQKKGACILLKMRWNPIVYSVLWQAM